MSNLLLFPAPADAAARRTALDPDRSILVQAPAGAGKTNLLTERLLALLARVEEPEQILAITFTRAATAEMRVRILGALEGAARGADQAEPLRSLAREALAHSERLGWQLLDQPHRLQVETIDSLCLRLAHGQPLLARLGGALAPTEDAEALWKQAARRTTAQLDGELKEPLGRLLLRRDNNLPELERLLAGMLARRDAWLGALPLRFDEEVDWDAVQARLEQPFRDENFSVLNGLQTVFQASGEVGAELLALGRYAAASLDRVFPLAACEGCPAEVEQWLAVADLLLTKEGSPRKQWTVREGFPAGGTKSEKERAQTLKQRMKDCAANLCNDLTFLALLTQLRRLPPLGYSEDQWQTLVAVLAVLRRAAAELRLVFAEANAVDFVEIARAAEQVLRDEASMRGLLESERKQHILIDEFQDTSRTQYVLIAQLLKEWTPGDGRTAFVVGDPLQSIYGFRQAEVALFHETRERGLPCGDEDTRHACHPLQLTHNFRSHAGLVGELNRRFAAMFDGGEDKFVPAQAEPSPEPVASFHVHALEESEESERDEAERVVEVLRGELPRIAEAGAAGRGEYRVAVLVRSRPHLRAILPALRAAGIPYRAVDLEPLAERPEIVDLHALVRALLHPGDRVAWLTVLRAPWCGLALVDLHALAGADEPELAERPFVELIPARMRLLSEDGRARAERVWTVLEAALRTRYAGPSLAAWVERAWMALGGPACVGPTGRDNAEAFLRLLDGVSPSGVEVLDGSFEARLGKLSAAPDPGVSERFGVQVMTIHKAKGLGFEVVLVPGLERQPRANGGELVAFLERNGERGTGELLLAPIGSREESEDRLYAWVQRQKREREAAERKRLFYVACTRARTRLHLFGTVRLDEKDGAVRRPGEGSLLEAAWAGLEADFRARLAGPGNGLRLAAAAEPGRSDEALLERLPSAWHPAETRTDLPRRARGERRALYGRAEGSAAARVRGRVLHALMEELGRGVREEARLLRAAQREARAAGLAQAEWESLARVALAAAATEVGRWIFTDRPGGEVERAYGLWDPDGNLRSLRLDRVFTAGAALLSEGATHRWVVDYKTGAGPVEATDAWRAGQRELYAGQMEAYAEVAAEGLPVRCLLFYPELGEAVWWAAEEPAGQIDT